MRPDDFKPGLKIIMTGSTSGPHECPPWPHSHEEDAQVDLCGTVLQIVAVNLPFIAVSVMDDPSFPIDTRKYNFVKANRAYARAHEFSVWQREEPCECPSCRPSRTPAAQKSEGLCPGCGDKLIQRRVGENKWAYRCRTCDV